ncbi:MAG: aldo/keto reductase, partial [Pseudomonadota bacterium]|nr:aldo/keto reductase [Pseudomonadota bacterium]
MRYNQLGRTGLYVSEICLGAMTFGGQGMWQAIGALQQDETTQLIDTALKAGVNFIDTADVYSEGKSERLVGQALKDLGVKRSDVVIATKVYGDMGKAPNDRGASRGHIMDGVKASLERLQLDHIDLYQIHGNDVITPLEETMRALDDLVREGLVRYIGVSNWAAWKITKANMLADARGWTRFATLQAYYSVAGRDLERDLAPMMMDQNMGLMAWSPLAGGFLSGKFTRDQDGPQGSRRTT